MLFCTQWYSNVLEDGKSSYKREFINVTRIVELLLHFPAGDERHKTIDKPRQEGGEKTYQKIGCHDLIIFSGVTHIRFLKPDWHEQGYSSGKEIKDNAATSYPFHPTNAVEIFGKMDEKKRCERHIDDKHIPIAHGYGIDE